MHDKYKLIQDNDGHWYCINADEAERFRKLEAAGQQDGWQAFHMVFGEKRIGGSPSNVTFENPEW